MAQPIWAGRTDNGLVSLSSVSVVPANRLGQLLSEARLRTGGDLEELASRSDFTVGELSDLEAGHRLLSDDLVSEVTNLYEVDCGIIVPQRAELTIDMTDRTMSAAGRAVRLDSQAHDHVLDRYLSLVYLLRNSQPGREVPLRDEDLAILAASLAEREELIADQLRRAMADDTDSVRGLVAWFKNRLWVPRAGALIGAVSVGTLVMISSDTALSPNFPTEPEPDPDPDGAGNGDGVTRPNAVAGLILPRNTTPATGQAPITDSATPPVSSVDAPDLNRPTPTTAVGERPATRQAEIGAQAEGLLPFDWQAVLPDWRIVYSGPNEGFRGLTYPYEQSIEMFVRDDDTPESLAAILAHELGHAIDVTYLDDGHRDMWRESRQLGDVQWWPDAYASDFQVGAGDFAEGFAYWALKDPSSSQIAGDPTNEQLATLEAILGDIF